MPTKRIPIVRFYENADETLMFNMIVESIADVVAAPFEFDGPATSQHIAGYQAEYQEFIERRKVDRETLIEAEVVKRVKSRLETKV